MLRWHHTSTCQHSEALIFRQSMRRRSDSHLTNTTHFQQKSFLGSHRLGLVFGGALIGKERAQVAPQPSCGVPFSDFNSCGSECAELLQCMCLIIHSSCINTSNYMQAPSRIQTLVKEGGFQCLAQIIALIEFNSNADTLKTALQLHGSGGQTVFAPVKSVKLCVFPAALPEIAIPWL